MGWLWSAKNNAFFHSSKIEDYKRNSFDLRDLIEVGDDVFDEYSESRSGVVRGVGGDGNPCWVDAPPMSHVDLVAQYESAKSVLQCEAEDVIKPLERANKLGIATDGELESLTEWERYSVLLMRVDTSLAPNIEWPQKPQ